MTNVTGYPPPFGQVGIARSGDGRGVEVLRPDRPVVGEEVVAEYATVVAHVHRHTRQELVLDGDAVCPIVGRIPQPWRTSGLTVVVLNGLPKFRLVHGPQTSPPLGLLSSATLLVRLQSTAKLLFESVHRSVRRLLERDRRVRNRVMRVVVGRLQVFAHVSLDRRLAVAEQVVCGAHARRDVVIPRDAILLGEEILRAKLVVGDDAVFAFGEPAPTRARNAVRPAV